jgi:hypothetical protein
LPLLNGQDLGQLLGSGLQVRICTRKTAMTHTLFFSSTRSHKRITTSKVLATTYTAILGLGLIQGLDAGVRHFMQTFTKQLRGCHIMLFRRSVLIRAIRQGGLL